MGKTTLNKSSGENSCKDKMKIIIEKVRTISLLFHTNLDIRDLLNTKLNEFNT